MPRALKICSLPGCPEFAPRGETRCETHTSKAFLETHGRKTHGWDSSEWKRPPGWARLRQSVLYRDKGICQYCGAVATEVDHVIPLSQGGSNKKENLKASCRRCNLSKNSAATRGREWNPPAPPTPGT